jgi:ABC-type sugar transport system substrate-binding protein
VAKEPDDGLSAAYYQKLKGKKVAFVPNSMGFDMTKAWVAIMKKQADDLGYELIVRDPNWNSEVGAQALEQLIDQKPDILMMINNDLNSYDKLIQKAVGAGINVIQTGLKAPTNGDAYVGTDWYREYSMLTQEVFNRCSTDKGGNGKVAVVYGLSSAPGVQIGEQATHDLLAAAGNKITLVADQSGEWDASKSHDVTATILQQHPDLCGIVGSWDNADVGTAAAIAEAGLKGKVVLVTSGGAERQAACDNIANGNFTSYISANSIKWAGLLDDTIKTLLQTAPKAGSNPFALYLPMDVIDKSNMHPSSCWSLEEVTSAK